MKGQKVHEYRFMYNTNNNRMFLHLDGEVHYCGKLVNVYGRIIYKNAASEVPFVDTLGEKLIYWITVELKENEAIMLKLKGKMVFPIPLTKSLADLVGREQ